MTGRGLGLLLACAMAWAGWAQVTTSLPAPGPVEERIAGIRKLMDGLESQARSLLGKLPGAP